MPPKENRDDRNAKRPANTGNVRAGRCYVRGMITLALLCREKSVYLGFRASHIPMPSVAEDLGEQDAAAWHGDSSSRTSDRKR
jgi:hypothetical protein